MDNEREGYRTVKSERKIRDVLLSESLGSLVIALSNWGDLCCNTSDIAIVISVSV